MNTIHQYCWYAVELALYGLAGLLVLLSLTLGLSFVGLPLVPPVLAAALAFIWLARHPGHGDRGTGAAGQG